jgi:hypothetical protein
MEIKETCHQVINCYGNILKNNEKGMIKDEDLN